MKENVEVIHGLEFLQLGYGNINMQCQKSLKGMATSTDNEKMLLREFMQFKIQKEQMLEATKDYFPQMAWGQMKGPYPNLSELLVDIFKALGSTGGVGRNQKVGKRVLSQKRCRSNDISYQKQVSISHNNVQLERQVLAERTKGFREVISRLCTPLQTTYQYFDEPDQDDISNDAMEWDDEAVLLETCVLDIEGPEKTPDAIIFPDVD